MPARGGKALVHNLNDGRGLALHPGDSGFGQRQKRAVHQHQLCAGMAEDIGHGVHIQPGVDGFSTAPQAGTPKCASAWAGMLGSSVATTSPGRMPRAASAEASSVTRRA